MSFDIKKFLKNLGQKKGTRCTSCLGNFPPLLKKLIENRREARKAFLSAAHSA